MAITTADGLVGAARQLIPIVKSTNTPGGTFFWLSSLNVAGAPGAGSLSVGNTSAGLVPTSATAGFPVVNAFGGGNTGYLAAAAYSANLAGRIYLKDRLYHVGSISCTTLATTTLASQPSATGRMPDGAGAGCEIWVEVNTGVSNTATSIQVTYTNSAGTTGQTSAAVLVQNFVSSRVIQVPLAAGDSGVQKIESVIVGGTVATTGSVNVIIARPLATLRVPVNGGGDTIGFDRTGLPIVYDTSALWTVWSCDTNSVAIYDLLMSIVNG